jgi:leucyl aminopeptidase
MDTNTAKVPMKLRLKSRLKVESNNIGRCVLQLVQLQPMQALICVEIMNFQLAQSALNSAVGLKADAMLVLLPETAKTTGIAALDAALKAGDASGKAGKTLFMYQAAGFAAAHVAVVGCGAGSGKEIRQAVAAGFAAVKAKKPKTITVVLSTLADPAVDAAVQALQDASYAYTHTKPKADGRSLERATIAVTDKTACAAAFARGVATAQGVELAKEWVNRPGNHATPTMLGKAAQDLAKRHPGISCEVLGPKQVAKLGMGSFMAVAQGSAEELRFIVLSYKGAAAGQAPQVLVGKGITFDTGGISIKPAPDMDEMKSDMGGAASVLGTFEALGRLKPAINVIGLIASCENMPDGTAIKPGDVVTSMAGQTIEILNTDAEGRLILCDALTYAERFKPAAVIDIATLTGACVIALGAVRSGMFASTDELAKSLFDAGEASGDLCWRMPLDDEYAEGLKTNFADVANVAGRAGGSITAAKFLQRFASKYAWGHLDIAGTAFKSGAAKGGTGRPVGLLLTYLLNAAAASVPAKKAVAAKKTARA